MQIQLSISVLVSDRAKTADKCLKSLEPILRNIPSELIVVYTGKSDASMEIAKKYTDNIIPFTWCDDFSKARNVGLKKAAGEWFMFIDDDEWFEDCSEIIDFFKNNEYRKYASACYIVKNYFNMEGTRFSDIHAPRMIKNTGKVEFIGLVHEALSPWNGPVKYFTSYAHHYGYAAGNPDRSEESYVRNIPLLEKQIAEEPKNMRYYVQLAQEYLKSENYKKAELCCRKILEIDENRWTITYPHWATAFLILTLVLGEETEKAYDESLKLLSTAPLAELYEMNIYINLARVCYNSQHYKEGIQFAKKFTSLKQKLDKEPQKWADQQLLEINRTNALKKSYYVYACGALCACKLADFQMAVEFLAEIDWESNFCRDEKHTLFENLKGLYPEQTELLLTAFNGIESDDIYILLQQAFHCESRQKYSEVKELYERCQKNTEYDFAYQLVMIALRNGFEAPHVLDVMDLEDWRNCAQNAVESMKGKDKAFIFSQSDKVFCDYLMQKMVFQQKLLAVFLHDKNLEKQEFIDMLQKYCDVVLGMNRILYRDELFEDKYLFCLPKECRAALDIEKVLLGLKNVSVKECVEKIRKLIIKYPMLSFMAHRLTDYVEEKYDEFTKDSGNQEFHEMGGKVKEIMKSLADKEQYQEALKVAKELEILLPDDVEVKRYRQLLQRMLEES